MQQKNVLIIMTVKVYTELHSDWNKSKAGLDEVLVTYLKKNIWAQTKCSLGQVKL
jgi:hypothetical protein